MLNNINTTDEKIYYLDNMQRNGARVVKLSSFDSFHAKTSKLKEDYQNTHKEQTSENEVNAPAQSSNIEVSKNKEVTEASNVLPLTSEETMLSKKDALKITVYQDIDGGVINLKDYQKTRRLRVNKVVVGNANRARNVLGIEREAIEIDNSQETQSNTPFDFSNVVGENVEKQDNDVKLDQYLNKETSVEPLNTNDAILNEVNELQNKRNDNVVSLATQKEILEALRARIAANEELCRQRKQQLEEENLALTQELSDVLDEISKLTSLAKEQEAFLGTSDREEGIAKAA